MTTPVLAAFVIARTTQLQELMKNLTGLVFFFVLYTVSEVLYVPLPRGGGVSVGIAIILACAAIYGAGPTALVSGLGMVVGILIGARSRFWAKYTFNFGQVAISSLVAGQILHLVRGSEDANGLIINGISFFIASAAFFLVNVGLVVSYLSSLNCQPPKLLWPDVRHTLSSYFALVPIGILVSLIFRHYGILGSLLFCVPLLLARYSFLRYLSVKNAGFAVSHALATALEAKDAYTRGHSDRVADYAERVARELDLSEESVEAIRYAAQLHDIGKIGINETLLNKQGLLSDIELKEIQEHSILGAQMLAKVDFIKGIPEIIKYHHEWFDGSRGYPRELRGTDIPLGARILMVCDAYDAMTSDRPYRKSLDKESALAELQGGAGTQFDPAVVEAFLRVLAMQHDPYEKGKQPC
jgi:putative nucleotidyltransferase with HDIG domain